MFDFEIYDTIWRIRDVKNELNNRPLERNQSTLERASHDNIQ